ncbi:MAG: hypothetical protein JJ908_14235 [Rhizobiales bacterium]|nr:hypothetical protein [Hyphomicrobiales bacterium]MBO6700310.1 hypothetical protein [Hyphomicrobiales bacterium]MBO6737525.1 hypothetical protein [Hyphomicrobiales bacterium]MBO6913418.1 hypothetical protein [Hyphomicrobiales bacterium]MBO6955349.1 hypothetical protein [Hyphomicrobiales bacterium]
MARTIFVEQINGAFFGFAKVFGAGALANPSITNLEGSLKGLAMSPPKKPDLAIEQGNRFRAQLWHAYPPKFFGWSPHFSRLRQQSLAQTQRSPTVC